MTVSVSVHIDLKEANRYLFVSMSMEDRATVSVGKWGLASGTTKLAAIRHHHVLKHVVVERGG